jgi:hypothetical protein
MKELMEMENKELWRLAMDEEMLHLEIMIHGIWPHYLIDGN